jgi:hypothetical protein
VAGRALIEIAITNTGGTATIDAIKSQMDALGVSILSVKESGDQQDKTLQNLLNRLEPARVATEKLASSQQILQQAFDAGKITQDQYTAGLDTLWQKYNATTAVTNQAAVAADALKEKYAETAPVLDTLKQKLEQVQGGTLSFGSALEQLAPKLTAMLTNPIVLAMAALVALGKGLESIGSAAADEELVNAKLSATWTANAGAAGISKERLDQLAQSLSDMSGVSRDTIKNAEALGLTFDQVTGPMFERMIKDALDMSSVTGRDLNSSLEQLGRALQNPAAGLATLTRSGVTFTQAVREQIKAMANGGDQMGAMNLILDQVEGKFENGAEVVGNTTVGAWNKLTNATKELMQSLGSPLLPAATAWLTGTTVNVQEATLAVDTWKSAFESFFETLGSGSGVMSSVTAFFQSLGGGSDEQLRTPAPALNLQAQFDALTKGVGSIAAPGGPGAQLFYQETDDGIQDTIKAYAALQASFDPLAKATQDYKTQMATLNEAVKLGINLGGDYQKVLDGAKAKFQDAKDAASGFTKALKDSNDYMKGEPTFESPLYSSAFPSDAEHDMVDLGEKSADYFTTGFIGEWSGPGLGQGLQLASTSFNSFASYAGANFGMTMGAMVPDGIEEGIEAGVLGGLAGVVPPLNKWAVDLQRSTTKAFQDGFLAIFEGKGLSDAWKSFSDQMAKTASKSLGDMLTGLLTGKDSQGHQITGITGSNGLLAAGGLEYTDPVGGQTSFNWGAAGSMAGGAISSNAQAKGSQGEGALGGALSGAASGYMMMGGPADPYSYVGAIVGAVVGAAMGYFGTAGAKGYSMNVAAGSTQPADWTTKWQQDTTQGGTFSSVGVSTGGVANTAALTQMSQQVSEKASSTQDSLQELLVLMKQQTIANPAWSATLSGTTSDVSTAFNQFLNNTMPQAVFQAFSPALTTGLEALGVSADRAKNEMDAVISASDFSKAMASLQAYVQALLDFGTETTELQKPLSQLVSDASMGAVQKWAESLATTQTSIGNILQSFSALSSTDQVSQATQAVSLINQQISANQQLMASLVSTGKQIDQSFQSIFDSIATTTATSKGTGALQAYLTSQFTTAFAALQGLNPATSSTEDLSAADQAVQSWASSLMNLSQTLQGLVPQFDTLNTTFTDLGTNLATGVGKTMATFGESTLTLMQQQTADTVTQVDKLRQGLNALDPASDVNTLNQIGSLTQQQYANNISELNTILGLEQSIGQSITSEMQNWKLQDAQAAGPQAEGNYLVQQLMSDYGALQKGGLTPEQVSTLTSEITSLADTLHGMGTAISLTGPGGQPINTTDWLDQLLQAVNTMAQGQLNNAANGVQSANQQLQNAISGLATYIATDTSGLNKAIGDIATLINTDLHGALSTSDALIGDWEGQVVAANAALQKEVDDFVTALTTLTSAAQGAANTLKDLNGIPQTTALTPPPTVPGGTGGGGGGVGGGGKGPVVGGSPNPTGDPNSGLFGSEAASVSATTKSLDGLGAAVDTLQAAHVAAVKAVQALSDGAQAAGDSLVDSANAFAQIMANAAASAKAAGWA